MSSLADHQDYGCYIIDRRSQGVEESVNDLVRGPVNVSVVPR